MGIALNKIEVYIWGLFVGTVFLDEKQNCYAFAYDSEFTKTQIELAPLQMPLKKADQPFIFDELPSSTYKRLPAMLSDVLSDGFGSTLINKNMTPLERLALIGDSSMDALEFRPALSSLSLKPSPSIQFTELLTLAKRLADGHLKEEDKSNHALQYIFSVGGSRSKALIAWNPKTQEIRSGQFSAPPDFEHWLLKFNGIEKSSKHDFTQDYGRIEYAYYMMATEAGIWMSESQLLCENCRAHFMTKRFDREPGHIKHHVQSLCAMSRLDYQKKATNSYEQLFSTMKELKLDVTAFEQAYRRMIFNVMASNCDDHTKNFAFMLRQGSLDWELSPAYDVTYSYNPKGEWTHQHLMSVAGKFKNFVTDDFLKVADQFEIDQPRATIQHIQDVIKQWPKFAKRAGLSKEATQFIGANFVNPPM